MRKSRIKYFLVIAMAFACIPNQGFSQSDSLSSVTGIVEIIEDSTNLFFSPPNTIEDYPQALPNANITLMRPDSTVVTGATSDQGRGRYEIDGIHIYLDHNTEEITKIKYWVST